MPAAQDTNAETVRTLVVDPNLPELAVGEIVEEEPVEETELASSYFDTPDLRLIRSGVTVRRDLDGEKSGWRVGVDEGSSYLEFPFPATRTDRPPAAIRRMAQAVARGEELEPVAQVRSRRQLLQLLDADGRAVAELGRGRVVATRVADGVEAEWHEVEVRPVDGSSETLDLVVERLVTNGAAKSDPPSRLRRALGDRVPPSPPSPSKKSSAADVVGAYLGHVQTQLLRHDVRLRASHPEAVHQMRTNARRLRSALATYRKLFRPGSTRSLEDGLRWLGQQLSAARDLQVVDALLVEATDPGSDSPAPVSAVRPLRKAVAAKRRSQGRAVAELLKSDAYHELLDDLAAFVEAPPFRGRASRPARAELRRGVRRAHRRVVRRWASSRTSGEAAALHDVRKAAKRLRYACEVAEPVIGKDARRLRRRAKSVSGLLGDRQDLLLLQQTVVDLLPAIGTTAAARTAAFELGQLRARQDERIDDLEGRAAIEMAHLRSSKASRWLR